MEQELVREFLAHLRTAGCTREQLFEKGYVYALALQTDKQPKEESYISAKMLLRAAVLLEAALPQYVY